MTSELGYEPPRRFRWPRFRLSTILVLTAILAWAMSYWPFYDDFDPINAMIVESQQSSPNHVPFSGYRGLDQHLWFWKLKLIAERVLLPELALAAFLWWKGTSALLAWCGTFSRVERAVDRVRLVAAGIAISVLLVFAFVYFIEVMMKFEFR